MNSQQALQELQNFQSTRRGAGDYYTQSQNELGVGAAQQQANDLRGLIRNTETSLKAVPDSVAGRTQGSLVTSAQRQRLQNLESAPIADQLSGYNRDYGERMADYRDLLGQAGTRAGLAYQTDTDKANALQKVYENIFGREQYEAQQAAERARLAEQVRQFNEQMRREDAKLSEMKRQTSAALNFRPNVGAAAASQPVDYNKILQEAVRKGDAVSSNQLQSGIQSGGLKFSSAPSNQKKGFNLFDVSTWF